MPTTYKDETYRDAALWMENTRVEYGENRKRIPSKSYDRYEGYRSAKTLKESLKLGSYWQDLLFDYEHGMLKVVGGPLRKEPLDLTKRHETLTHFELMMAKSVAAADQTVRTEVLAEKLGVDKKDLSADKGNSESIEMHGHRKSANAAAKQILRQAKASGRKISSADMVEVLSLWAFKRNHGRLNVIPDGDAFVKSDTVGLIPLRNGTTMATSMTSEYPDFCRVLCQWLKDNSPKELGRDFVFSSININADYAAKRHRDQSNCGPSMIKAFGRFSGGRLLYFPEDDRSTKLELLRPRDAAAIDLRSGLALFDGNRAHAVESFRGRRLSLVWFTVSRFWRADAESCQACTSCGIVLPTKETMQWAKSLLRPAGRAAAGGASSPTHKVWRIADGSSAKVGNKRNVMKVKEAKGSTKKRAAVAAAGASASKKRKPSKA